MTKSEFQEYIKVNGNAEAAIATLKQMNAEGAPMTIDELDARLHPKKNKKSRKKKKKDAQGGSTILTLFSVFLAILLLGLLFIIFTLQLAPDSAASIWIDTIVENIVTRYASVESWT